MVAIPLDKINYNKVSKYANVLIFKEFYPKTKNVSYYLNYQLKAGVHNAYTFNYKYCNWLFGFILALNLLLPVIIIIDIMP